ETGWQSLAWERCLVRTAADLDSLLDHVLDQLSRHGFSRKEQFGVRLALEEAVVNGIKHGHGGDPAKAVQVGVHVEDAFLVLPVQDEGPGFNPDRVAAPLADENIDRPCGRGLCLMRHYMHGVKYNAQGNGVLMCKLHEACPPSP